MDLFCLLPEKVRERLFHIRADTKLSMPDLIDGSFRIGQLLQHLKKNKNAADEPSETNLKKSLSKIVLQRLPTDAIQLNTIRNPYAGWRREPSRNMFTRGHKKSEIPNGKFQQRLKDDTAYIVKGYSDSGGSYGKVYTFVVYRGQRAVIKLMGQEDYDLFELVTQSYMHEACKKYKNIQVPELLFLQKTSQYTDKSGGSNPTCACMTVAKGIPLKCCRAGRDIKIALAHCMRALYRLQNDFHFMHRDLSASNIYFDKDTDKVTFIDFGMACVNPNLEKNAWQSADESLFEKYPDSNASKCSNRSLDASILIAWLSQHGDAAAAGDLWCHEQHMRMKQDYTSAIKKSLNATAKERLSPSEKLYTVITSGDWSVGNNLSPQDGPHYWLYDMVEFPVEEWYPENVLQRILRTLEVEDWFAIRKGWSKTFDNIIMPNIKNRRITLADGREGIVREIKAKPNRCVVLVEGQFVTITFGDPGTTHVHNDVPTTSTRKAIRKALEAKRNRELMTQRVRERSNAVAKPQKTSRRPHGNNGSAGRNRR